MAPPMRSGAGFGRFSSAHAGRAYSASRAIRYSMGRQLRAGRAPPDSIQ